MSATLSAPMSATMMGRDAWKPEQPGGFGVGAIAALVAHVALVAALAVGVSWRTSPTDTALSAELWAAVPEVAAPKPVEPPPTPPTPEPRPAPKPQPDPRIEQQRQEAQIAIEKAAREKKRRQEQEEKERAEQLKAEKAREEKLKAEKLKEERLKEEKRRAELTAKLREDQLARMRDLAGTGPQASTGSAQRDAAPSAGYAGRIRARIKPNLLLVGEIAGNPVVEIEVRCAPDGRIISRRVTKSSGNPTWDETVLRAIDRTEILPRDTDGRIPASMTIQYARQE